MKLLRLATINLKPPPDGWDSWEITAGRCTVRTLAVRGSPPADGSKRLVVIAEIPLEGAAPEIGDDGLLTPPIGRRKVCERAVETVASTISVLARSVRRIASPMPPLALVAESELDHAHLAKARGIRCDNRAYHRPRFSIPASPEILEGLRDRVTGVAVVADLLAQRHALAQYREAIRFFEIAFSLPAVQLEKKLAQFLSSTTAGYERPEIAAWMSMRHAAIHGDRPGLRPLVVEADVRPFMARIEQAVMDVLLNKAEWHRPSRTRRALFVPPAVTSGPAGGLCVIEKSLWVMETQLLDPFGAYPMDSSTTLSAPPAQWWCPFGEEHEVHARIDVLPQDPLASGRP